MPFPETINILLAWLQSPAGLAVMAVVGSWFAGAGVTRLLAHPFTQRILGAGLLTAKAPGLALGKAASVPPFRFFVGPVVCLLIFVGFWFFSFMDALLSSLSPDVQKLASSLEEMLGKMGSTERKLYIQAKKMTTAQVVAVSQMAEAVAAGPDKLDSAQQDVLLKARAIGADLQQNRLESAP
jgi:hypothetical protein